MTKSANKQPTWVSLTHKALQANQNDFMSLAILCQQTGGTKQQISAALSHMRKHKVCDVVIENDGRGWWFLQPVELDDRECTVLDRVPEVKPRKKRVTKVQKVTK